MSRLLEDGWDVVTTGWRPYDERMPWGADSNRLTMVEADLTDPAAPSALLEQVEIEQGPVTALVMAHAESIDSSILDTTVESFDRHSRSMPGRHGSS